MTIEQKYITHLENCFAKALNLDSKINQEIKDMQGMTGEMTRHFYNNLLSIEGVRYLEIGAWMGSSSCAAMFGNKAGVTIIDDFSGFGSPKEEFLKNFDKFKGENNALFIEEDCFKVDVNSFKDKFNIYLFDGDHSEASQYKAIEYYLPCLDDVFVLIVDDWNWQTVRDGTNNAIADKGLKVLWKKEIRTTDNNEFPDQEIAKNTFWNGIAVFVLKK